jgi:hypothetical protein
MYMGLSKEVSEIDIQNVQIQSVNFLINHLNCLMKTEYHRKCKIFEKQMKHG